MKNSTIELLYQGKKRKVQKQQYSKLRTYNKIKNSRCDLSQSSGFESTSRSRNNKQEEVSAEQLVQIIEAIKQDNVNLSQQNAFLAKQIKKYQKIDRIIFKKCATLNQTKQNDIQAVSYENNLISTRDMTLKDIQTMLEAKLSLDVIQLQSQLEQKNQLHKKLQLNRRKKYEQEIMEKFCHQKVIFLNFLNEQQEVQHICQKLQKQGQYLREKLQNLQQKLRNSKKSQQNEKLKLQQIDYQLKELKRSSEQRTKRIRKNSCEYIQVENGEVKNHQDIKNELKQIIEKRKLQSAQTQQFLQQKMLDKIKLVNQIEKLQIECRRLNERPGVKNSLKNQSINLI